MIVCPALVVNVPARRFTMKIAHFALWTQQLDVQARGNDSNLLIVFYVQIMPDDLVMQLHRF